MFSQMVVRDRKVFVAFEKRPPRGKNLFVRALRRVGACKDRGVGKHGREWVQYTLRWLEIKSIAMED